MQSVAKQMNKSSRTDSATFLQISADDIVLSVAKRNLELYHYMYSVDPNPDQC